MSDEQIKTILANCINEFRVKEIFLLENNVNERTISHRFACMLQGFFPYLYVDYEYNKLKLNENTKLYESISESKKLGLSTPDDYSTVFPDITVHKRGKNEDNLLVIAVKKKDLADTEMIDGNQYRDFDKSKILAYKKHLHFKYGLYLEFNGDIVSECRFYS